VSRIPSLSKRDLDFVARTGSPVLSRPESVSQGGPRGAWLVHYEIGGQQLTITGSTSTAGGCSTWY
jgi:hypothetical protein